MNAGRRILRTSLAAGAALGVLVTASMAAAQTSNEVVVTANKRTERLKDVAMSDSAISGQELATAQALDLQDILESAGAGAVACHADADEALRVLREGARFDLAVLDVHLGGATRTSYSVAAALTVQRTPFVFLTGMRRDATIAAEYPQVPILEKPYQHAHVLEAVRNVLAK